MFLFLLQIVIVDSIFLGWYFTPYIYIVFFLFLPLNISRNLLLTLSFLMGLWVDFFMQSLGFHALALLVMNFIRPLILRRFEPSEGYQAGALAQSKRYNFIWFFLYASSSIIVFHAVLLIAEKSALTGWVDIGGKILFSSLITLCFAFLMRAMLSKSE